MTGVGPWIVVVSVLVAGASTHWLGLVVVVVLVVSGCLSFVLVVFILVFLSACICHSAACSCADSHFFNLVCELVGLVCIYLLIFLVFSLFNAL